MDPFRRFDSRDKEKPSTEQERAGARKHRREKRDAGAAAGLPRFLQRSPASPAGPARDARLGPLDAGRALDEATRARMEGSYGRDLSDVRVHTGASAAAAAASLEAQAFTTGRDIVFGAGAYAPETKEGTRLLAHELAHVVQQASGAGASAASGDQVSIGGTSDRFEHGAEHAAAQVVDGPRAAGAADLTPSTAVDAAAGAPAIQRQELPAVPEVTLRPSPFLARSIGSGRSTASPSTAPPSPASIRASSRRSRRRSRRCCAAIPAAASRRWGTPTRPAPKPTTWDSAAGVPTR